MQTVLHESHPGLDYGGVIDCSSVASFAVAVAVAVAWLALVVHALVSWARARHARRSAAVDLAGPGERITEGACEIIGEVVAEGEQPVATLTISQSGVNRRSKGRTWHEWRETDRRTTLRPFSIRTPAGLVRVAVDNARILTTSLETLQLGPRERQRLAEIRPGERIVAHGEVIASVGAGGYRGETTWELQPAGGRPCLSTASRSEEAARAQRYFGRALPHLAGWALALQLGIFGPFWLLAVAGHVEPVVIESAVVHYAPRHPRSATESCVRGVSTSGPVRAVTSRYVRRGDVVPVLIAPWHLTYSIGPEPRADFARCYFALVLLLLGSLVYFGRAADLKPWWKRERLVETGLDSLPAL